MEWEKNGVNITGLDQRIKISDKKLVIEKPTIDDMGNYACKIFKGDTMVDAKNISVIGKSTISFAFTKFCLFCFVAVSHT